MNYQPMATALRGSGLAVLRRRAARPRPRRRPRALRASTSATVVRADHHRARPRRGLTSVSCCGATPPAPPWPLATAHRLTQRGVRCRRVFLAAQLPGDAGRPARRRRRARRRAPRRDRRAAERASGGYPELASWTRNTPSTSPPPTGTTASPPTATSPTCSTPRPRTLSAPVTVVVAADDPSTAGESRPYRDWERSPSTSTCTSSPMVATTSCAPARPRRRGSCCARADLLTTSDRPATERTTTCRTRRRPRPCSTCDRQPGRPPLLQVAARRRRRAWAAAHRDALRDAVAEHGSVLVRGLGLRDPAEVGAVFGAAGRRPAADRAGGVRAAAGLRRGRVLARRSGRRTSRCACTTS